MKNCFTMLVMSVLLYAVPLSAQKPVVELPELQEWYSWSGAQGSQISYLPNFDVTNGGVNAVTQLREGNPTWYNRFAYDTTNKFTWESSRVITRADLNGDGITDYVDGAGNVYQGIQKNAPPVRVLGVTYTGVKDGGYVADYNNDGYQDIIVPFALSDRFLVLFGGKDLLHLRSTVVKMPPDAFGIWTGMVAYTNEVGQARFISHLRDKIIEGFYLYGLTFEGTPNDSVIVTLKQLYAIEEKITDPNKLIFFSDELMFYYDIELKNYFINIAEYPDATGKIRRRAYEIKNDAFKFIKYDAPGSSKYSSLNGSIDGDSIPDVIEGGIVWENGEKKRYIYVYSGNSIFNGEPRAYFPFNKCDGEVVVRYIGDVTGDGIGDVAYGCATSGEFRIFKGVDWRKLSNIAETEVPNFTFQQTEPNPVGINGAFILPIKIEQRGNYSIALYDLTGKRLGELYSGELSIGELRLPLNVSAYHLPTGIYTLRLSDGKQTRERAFSLIH